MSEPAVQPAAPPARVNLLGMSGPALSAWLAEQGEKPFRATQLIKWMHQQGEADFARMTNLSKALREKLAAGCEVRAPEVVSEQLSADGTVKWLMGMGGRNAVETVFIPEAGRGTLCVSSQVGCALNCAFCSTARQGFARNLSSAEIIGQLWLARERLAARGIGGRAVTNVVMMGMGEPLLNFDAVCEAMWLMLEDNAYGLGRRRVTLSTAGVVPALRRLKERCPVALAVSLHAPNDRLRDELVPINRSYPIRELLAACRDYVGSDPKHVITFEYVLLDGVNDRPEHAEELAALLRPLPAKVNLIPWNPFEGAGFRRSTDAAIARFRDILLARGLMTITRKTRGDDIDAACGQLAGRVQARGRVSARRNAGATAAAAP